MWRNCSGNLSTWNDLLEYVGDNADHDVATRIMTLEALLLPMGGSVT